MKTTDQVNFGRFGFSVEQDGSDFYWLKISLYDNPIFGSIDFNGMGPNDFRQLGEMCLATARKMEQEKGTA
jgi:hypothetical protein